MGPALVVLRKEDMVCIETCNHCLRLMLAVAEVFMIGGVVKVEGWDGGCGGKAHMDEVSGESRSRMACTFLCLQQFTIWWHISERNVSRVLHWCGTCDCRMKLTSDCPCYMEEIYVVQELWCDFAHLTLSLMSLPQ